MNGQRRMTLAAALATLLAALPLAALTETHGWTLPSIVAIAIIAGLGVVGRRYRVPAILIVVAQLAALVLWLGILVGADVARFAVIPTLEWAHRLAEVTAEGLTAAQEHAAPVAVERGILLLIVGGVGLIAVAVDLVAVSLRRVPLAGVFLITNYLVVAGIFGGGISWFWFVLPAIGFLTLLAAEGRNRVAMWGRSATPSGRHKGIPETSSLARSGRRAGAVALGAAVIVPIALPVLSEGMLDGSFGSGSGSGSGRTIRVDNPVVDLQRRLNLGENQPVFQYATESEDRTYFKSSTYDLFTGDEWTLRPERRVPEAHRVTPDTVLPDPPGLSEREYDLIEYAVAVTDDFPWLGLPLPYPPHIVEIDGDWRYDIPTLDVIPADSDRDSPRGSTFRAQVVDVEYDWDRLVSAPHASGDFDHLRQIPDDVRAEIEPYLDEVLGDLDEGASQWEQAVALQNWFRTGGGFSYDLEVPESGTSSSELVNFLEVRVGFCQQYAFTMATMARAIGIPARVAVGWTSGDRQDDGTWLVGAHDAHAWPELYFEGTGWVLVEPTPARRTGVAPEWTLGADGQDGGEDTSASIPGDLGDFGAGLDDNLLGDGFDFAGGGGVVGGPSSRWLMFIAAGAAIAALLALPWTTARIRRELRWQRAGDDTAALAEAAWADLRDAVNDSALEWDPAATPRQIGHAVARAASLGADEPDRALLNHVVHHVERARYAQSVSPVGALRSDSDQLRRAVLRSQPRYRQIRAWLWPCGVSGLVTGLGNRLADGLDWLDAANHRLRERAVAWLPARR